MEFPFRQNAWKLQNHVFPMFQISNQTTFFHGYHHGYVFHEKTYFYQTMKKRVFSKPGFCEVYHAY
jgi:hypothetical protein